MTTCDECGRERTPEDSLNYSYLQALFGTRLGWYSVNGDEICGECMTKTIRGS